MASILKIQPTNPHQPEPTEITLKFDSPKEIEGNWGPQWMYGVWHEGEEKVIYATKGLHNAIENTGSKANDTLSIIRTGEGKETRWSVLHTDDISLAGDAKKGNSKPAPSRPQQTGMSFQDRYEQYGVAWDMAVDFLAEKQTTADVNAVAFTFYKMAMDAGHDLREPAPKE